MVLMDLTYSGMNKQTFTREEVIDLLVAERERAVEIAYDSYNKHQKTGEFRKKNNVSIAFVSLDIADEARCIGNCISGLNALSVTLGYTVKDEVTQDLNKKYPLE